MAEFIARWFTPSKATGVSGEQYNQQYNAQQQAEAAKTRRPAEVKQELRAANRPKKKTVTKFGGAPNQPALLDSEQAAVAKTLLGQ